MILTSQFFIKIRPLYLCLGAMLWSEFMRFRDRPFHLTNGTNSPSRPRWVKRATTSLPVPDCPNNNTFVSTAANWANRQKREHDSRRTATDNSTVLLKMSAANVWEPVWS